MEVTEFVVIERTGLGMGAGALVALDSAQIARRAGNLAEVAEDLVADVELPEGRQLMQVTKPIAFKRGETIGLVQDEGQPRRADLLRLAEVGTETAEATLEAVAALQAQGQETDARRAQEAAGRKAREGEVAAAAKKGARKGKRQAAAVGSAADDTAAKDKRGQGAMQLEGGVKDPRDGR